MYFNWYLIQPALHLNFTECRCIQTTCCCTLVPFSSTTKWEDQNLLVVLGTLIHNSICFAARLLSRYLVLTFLPFGCAAVNYTNAWYFIQRNFSLSSWPRETYMHSSSLYSFRLDDVTNLHSWSLLLSVQNYAPFILYKTSLPVATSRHLRLKIEYNLREKSTCPSSLNYLYFAIRTLALYV